MMNDAILPLLLLLLQLSYTPTSGAAIAARNGRDALAAMHSLVHAGAAAGERGQLVSSSAIVPARDLGINSRIWDVGLMHTPLTSLESCLERKSHIACLEDTWGDAKFSYVRSVQKLP